MIKFFSRSRNRSTRTRSWKGWRALFLSALFLLSAGLVYFSLVSLRPENPQIASLIVGTVAPQDIMSPLDITYESEVLTELQRENAANAVAPVYSAPDTQIAREQLDQLRAALASISSTRLDSTRSDESKLSEISLGVDQPIADHNAQAILDLSEAEWETVKTESLLVLQEIMRGRIQENNLESMRQSVPTLVSLSLTEEQAEIVTALVVAYLRPNSFFNQGLTEANREKARDQVEPVVRTFVRGETVIERGTRVSLADFEALEKMGFITSESDSFTQLNAGVVATLAMVFSTLYLRRQPALTRDLVKFTYITVTTLLFLYAARFSILGHTIRPYLFPFSAYGLLLASLFGPMPAILFSIPLSVLVTFGIPNALELNTIFILSTVFAVIMLDKAQQLKSFLWAGLAAGSLGAVIILAYRVQDPITDLIGMITLGAAIIFGGLLSAVIAALIQFLTAPLLGMTTPLQLMELTRPDHPLMRELRRKAAGTYQHSLQVASLAEQAAEQIGADALLTRIGALYHDIGKARRPEFFIENQPPGSLNPHDALSPEESASIIIGHVVDGIELARKHRLPRPVKSFIAEHHGTMVTRFQYIKALEAVSGDASAVDLTQFQYPGPRPQSRETALVMLADGCEARARAERPTSTEAILTIVQETIDQRWQGGQFNDIDLSARDLKKVRVSFAATLRGIYHPRIEYPEIERKTRPSGEREVEVDASPEQAT